MNVVYANGVSFRRKGQEVRMTYTDNASHVVEVVMTFEAFAHAQKAILAALEVKET